jgi:histidyl-tRNA synthetase
VCLHFWYKEYLWPLVEYAAVYKAKSWEDVGGSELTLLTDRDGAVSDIALRPEMTPTVTRMVATVYSTLTKPVKWFSIANFYRNERPQRWRNREFRQLNIDIFGESSLWADIEILQIALEILLTFGATQEMFVVSLNHRALITQWLTEVAAIPLERHQDVIRLMDKISKMSSALFIDSMQAAGFDLLTATLILDFVSVDSLSALCERYPQLRDSNAVKDISYCMNILDALWYGEYIRFAPSLMRWFDYYDGIVFEVFDKHPDNNRALFGGGRYNGLASIFGVEPFPAVWCAPGDESLRLFLESHDLLAPSRVLAESKVYFPVLDDALYIESLRLAQRLRLSGYIVDHSISHKKLQKSFDIAEKQWYTHILILWKKEQELWTAQLKCLATQEIISLSLW